jgi:leader peptidase (prepilin peptidase)/N-methyltransferase
MIPGKDGKMEIFVGVIIFILGLIIGSFLNVCIYRLPHKQSIVTSPSACPACGARLKPWDLVPVLSYVFLGGKCRYCKARISAQYPLIEALTGALYVLLYVRFGIGWPLLVYLALVSLLIVISLIDIRHMEIPDGLIIAGLVVGAAQLIASIFTPYFDAWHSYVIGFFAGGLPLLLIALFCAYILKKDGMGGGDIKLMAFCGFIIGWRLVITAYLIGIVAGAVFGMVLMALKKKNRSDAIPFGPFLSLGVVVSVFFGNMLIDWYMGLVI